VTFRTKLLLITSFTIAGAVALVTGAVSYASRQAFNRMDTERRQALLVQFRQELEARGTETARVVDRAAASPSVQQIAEGIAEYDRAQAEASAQGLDFLDVLQPDRTVISSAHYPARVGYKNDWQIAPEDWNAKDAFLARIPGPDGVAIALVAIRPIPGGKALVLGGRKLTSELMKSLGIAPGVRALLWLGPGEVIDAQGTLSDPGRLAQLTAEVQRTHQQVTGSVQWTQDRGSAEAFLAAPLEREGRTAGVLLAGTSLREQLGLERSILEIGVGVALIGTAIGVLLAWWTTERVTRPVARLVDGAKKVAAGDWDAQVEVGSRDEIGELAAAFNEMTRQLIEQRDRRLQAERVAAWRELARRLAHELKNPLFPLQLTIENLQRAKEASPQDFEETFEESTTTLIAELGNLKTIIGRFSDFAKMPAPHFEPVDLNQIVEATLKLYAGQLQANGRPKIEAEIALASEGAKLEGDEDQLRRALSNLVLNAIDAMPEGGTLRVATTNLPSGVRLSVSDSGQGLTPEETERLFTPYYTTKHHGTGLGLAIVQSVVSDHHGKISVTSTQGQGATFLIDLPLRQELA
jgi:two-component system, NtrC family, nitrogen regulation sensor histidine kinase NtrY